MYPLLRFNILPYLPQIFFKEIKSYVHSYAGFCTFFKYIVINNGYHRVGIYVGSCFGEQFDNT